MKFPGRKMFLKTLFGAIFLLVGAVSSVMIFVSLGRGNWIGAFFVFPVLCYLSLDKFYNLMKGNDNVQ